MSLIEEALKCIKEDSEYALDFVRRVSEIHEDDPSMLDNEFFGELAWYACASTYILQKHYNLLSDLDKKAIDYINKEIKPLIQPKLLY